MLSLAITSANDLSSTIMATYIMAICVGAVGVGIICLVANLIPWQTGINDTSSKTRTVMFWVMLIICLLAQVGLSWVVYYSDITKVVLQSRYFSHIFISGAVAAVFYAVVSIIIIKISNPKSKIGSIFR